jgi:Ferric iron reductase FhuF-like transporter
MNAPNVAVSADAASLEGALRAALAKFGRIGASYPLYIKAPLGIEVVPQPELLDFANLSSYFERSINEWTDHPEDEDGRAAASRFMRRLCGSVAAAALVPLANGVAFDVSIERVSLIIRNDMTLGTVLDLDGAEIFTSSDRPTTWPVNACRVFSTTELRERALRNLFADNLVPSFERVLQAVRVSPRLLWTTAAESIELLYEYGRPYFDEESWRPLEEDRLVLHFGASLPGVEGPNPMLGLLDWERFDDPLLPDQYQVRKICCVNYVIPGRKPSYCRTCGIISAEQRKELWRRYLVANRDATVCTWPPRG